METVNIPQTTEQQNGEISFAEIFFHYFSYWKWFIASIAVCLIIAFVYLRYTTSEYLVSSRVLIKDDKGKAANFDVSVFTDLGLFPQVGSFDNEIEILLSNTLMKSVSDSLKLGIEYYTNGRLKQIELYKKSPVFVSVTNQIDWGSFVLDKNDDGSFFMKSKSHKFEKQFMLNDTVTSPWGALTFKENPFGSAEFPIEVMIKHPKSLPLVLIAPLNKLTTVVDVSMTTATPQKGLDIINTLVAEYNRRAINEKNYVANHTIDFINERLVDISGELKTAEQRVEWYKKAHGLGDLTAEAQMSLSSQSEYTKKSVDVATQLSILRSVKSFLTNPENKNNIAPSNVGLTDLTVISLINKYNEEILAKTRAQVGVKESSQIIRAFNERIALLRDELIKGITMAESGLQTTLRSLEQQASSYLSKTMNLSTQERESRELYRQKEIKESLFIYLLQKKEETGLSLALATPNAVVIDEADYLPIPVKPKNNIIILAALLLGLIIPIAIIYVLDLFDNKVRSKEQLMQIVKAPFLGEVPQTKSTKFPVLNVRSGIAEKFRIIASNLSFVVTGDKRKVIVVTSTYSGDGKSFFSQNLAMSLATSGYKTLLIDLDMRKSVLNKTLSMNPSRGVAMFLSDPTLKLEDIIDKTGTFHKNLDIIPIKIFPPNPAELLASARLTELFQSLSSEYDYIVVDTAPVGLVADAFRVNQFADATIYVTRIDYTYKTSLPEIQHLYHEQKLKNMTAVLNAVPVSSHAYGYGNYRKNNYYTCDD